LQSHRSFGNIRWWDDEKYLIGNLS
jgi:hypothetical protein